MAWATAKGFNFRSTAAYVTDPSNSRHVLDGTDALAAYPTTNTIGGESVTYGFTDTTGLSKINRSLTVNAKLAGIVYQGNSETIAKFRVDLPASGSYKIRFALGDAGDTSQGKVEVYDDTTLKATIEDTAIAITSWVDALGTEHSGSAAWVSNNAQLTVSFATTICLVYITNVGPTTNSMIAHLELEQGAAAVDVRNQIIIA